MKKLLFLSLFLSTKLIAQDFTRYVNPMIGTGGHGHTYPGVSMPFGFCQLSPDTRVDGSWDGCSGYHYSDSIIYGFSHTHLSGTGCSDYGDILLMPVTKEVSMKEYDYASPFSHVTEHAVIGEYSVRLSKWNVKASLTCTPRVGIHDYQFPKNANQYVVLDLKHRDEVLDSKLEIVNDSTVRGYRFSKAWATNQKIYFYIQFSRPFIEKRLGNDVQAASSTAPINLEKQQHVLFDFGKSNQDLLVKVGLSGVDEQGAQHNLEQEAPHWDFQKYKASAITAWNVELSKIQLSSTFEAYRNHDLSSKQHDSVMNKLTVFYTALYHSQLSPTIYSDADNRYRGRDDKIHSTEGTFDYYTVFSLWDTYRALHPLLSIIDTKRTNDFINTFIKQYEEGGRLPIWELSSNETNCMIGYHVVSVMWDAYNKGIRDYDVNKAYEAMKSIATHFTDYDTVVSSKNKESNLMNEALIFPNDIHLKEAARKRCADADALESYCRYGYVRSDDAHESVSKTLEYAYDDWCIAQMAHALHKDVDYNYYLGRCHNWENVFDPNTGFMRARKNGTLYEPFSPYTVDNNYTEANSWQYSFYVPHEVAQLISVNGGNQKFEKKLNNLFAAKSKTEGREQADITGLIGQYAHGNEPSHNLVYLYNYIGKPQRMKQLIAGICDSFYANKPDGLIGNEDCGQMSAWYVLSTLGIYQSCPGELNYDFNLSPKSNVLLNGEAMNRTPTKLSSSIYTNTTEAVKIDRLAYSYANIQTNNIGASSFFNDDQVRELNQSVYSNFVVNPFIQGASKIFKGQQLIIIKSIQADSKIYFSLNHAEFKLYVAPIAITANSTIDFFAKNKNTRSPIQTALFTKLPTDRKVILKSVYNKSYSAGGPQALIDGLNGTTNWRVGDWQGYQGQDFEAVIAFSQTKKIHEVSANFLQDQRAWIFYPTEVSFYTSNDNVNWNLIETIAMNKPERDDERNTITKITSHKSTAAKFVKVVAKNYGQLPAWHPGNGGEAFIFIDEVEVN